MVAVLQFMYGVLIVWHIHYTTDREWDATLDGPLDNKFEVFVSALLCIVWPLYWAGRLIDAATQKLLPPGGESV